MGIKKAAKFKAKAGALGKSGGAHRYKAFRVGGHPSGAKTYAPSASVIKVHKVTHAAGYKTLADARETELAEDLVRDLEKSSSDVNALCETYKLRREELGRLTGFSLRALAEWAAGKMPSQPAQRRLREVRRLLDALSEIVVLEAIPEWLHKQNPAFDKLTPLQVIELGEIDRLWAMVYGLGSGQPS